MKPPKPRRVLLAALIAGGLWGCAHLSPPAPAAEEPGVVVRTLEGALASTPDVVQAPKPSEAKLTGPDGEGVLLATETRFDIAAQDVPASAFFMSLVDGTPLNVVLDPGIGGNISLELKNVTIDEAMDAVRDVYGYEFRKTTYGYHVEAQGLLSRVFNVDYLNVRRTGESNTRVSSGQVSDGARFSNDSGASSSGDAGSTSGSNIATHSETDFWTELQTALLAIIGPGDGRSVVTSPNTGIVVVRALPAELRAVQSFLRRARGNLERQVILEAKILEVTLSDGFQSGINWSGLVKLSRKNRLFGGQTGGGNGIMDGVSEIAGQTGVLDTGAFDSVDDLASSAFGGAFTLAVNSDDFNAFVELLETQGDVRTLSSPRVATLNNQRAVIKVGTDEFFVTDVSTTTVTGAATTTSPDITLTPFFSGIALDVTPQVNEFGSIILHIHPSISEVRDQTKVITVGGSDQSLPLALSTIRESDSIVRAASGQVIVIGGLMQDTDSRDRFATPWLNKIPLLGNLFTQRLDAKLRNELVILLRAVAVGPDTWERTLTDTADRVRNMPWVDPQPPATPAP